MLGDAQLAVEGALLPDKGLRLAYRWALAQSARAEALRVRGKPREGRGLKQTTGRLGVLVGIMDVAAGEGTASSVGLHYPRLRDAASAATEAGAYPSEPLDPARAVEIAQLFGFLTTGAADAIHASIVEAELAGSDLTLPSAIEALDMLHDLVDVAPIESLRRSYGAGLEYSRLRSSRQPLA